MIARGLTAIRFACSVRGIPFENERTQVRSSSTGLTLPIQKTNDARWACPPARRPLRDPVRHDRQQQPVEERSRIDNTSGSKDQQGPLSSATMSSQFLRRRRHRPQFLRRRRTALRNVIELSITSPSRSRRFLCANSRRGMHSLCSRIPLRLVSCPSAVHFFHFNAMRHRFLGSTAVHSTRRSYSTHSSPSS